MNAYFGLFLVALLSATLLPGGSELLFAGLYSAGREPLWLWLFATVGNTLGSWLNWLLGRYLLHYRERRWFPFRAADLERGQRWFQRYGQWSLLFAWAPLVGDALTFVAGVMRVDWRLFLLLTATGKGARYGFLLWLLATAEARAGWTP